MGKNTAGDIELSKMKIDAAEQSKVRRRRRRRRCCACCGACAILLLLIALVLVILAFTVFKPKNPRIHVDSIKVEDFDAKVVLDIPPSLKLTITIGVVVSVKNPNKVGFKFHNSTAYLFYRDKEVGMVPVPAGELGAGKTIQISTSLQLLADRLLKDLRLYADFIAGSLAFSTRTDVSGRINFLKIFKRHADTSTVCYVTVPVSNPKQSLNDFTCKYDVSL